MSLEIGLAPTNWIVSCSEVVLCIKRLRFYVWLQKNGCQEGSSCWGNKKLSLTDDINQRELVALSPEKNEISYQSMPCSGLQKKASTGSHGWERETWRLWLDNGLMHGSIWELNLWVKCTEHTGAYFTDVSQFVRRMFCGCWSIKSLKNSDLRLTPIALILLGSSPGTIANLHSQ